jgi:hypothetical protein
MRLTLPRMPVRPAPNGVAGVPGRLARAWHAVKGAFRPAARGLTAHEAQLLARLGELADVLHQRDEAIFQLRHDLAERDSEVAVLKREVQLLSDLHTRDRLRVEADSALYAHAVAHYTPRDPGAQS